MPFNIELKSATNETLHLIIDRNNILFVFPRENNSKKAEFKSYARRNRFAKRLMKYSPEISLFFRRISPDDPLHLFHTHVSEWDKKNTHLHLAFYEEVGIKHLSILFKNFPQEKLDPYISLESKIHLFAAALSYFGDLRSNPATKNIEDDYAREKLNKEIIAFKESNPLQPQEYIPPTPESTRTRAFNNFQLRIFDLAVIKEALEHVTPQPHSRTFKRG